MRSKRRKATPPQVTRQGKRRRIVSRRQRSRFCVRSGCMPSSPKPGTSPPASQGTSPRCAMDNCSDDRNAYGKMASGRWDVYSSSRATSAARSAQRATRRRRSSMLGATSHGVAPVRRVWPGASSAIAEAVRVVGDPAPRVGVRGAMSDLISYSWWSNGSITDSQRLDAIKQEGHQGQTQH